VKSVNIKVVGDIRIGKIQPSLTGNPIVDDVLIQHFCDQLKKQLTSLHLYVDIVADHFFDPTSQSPDIILMDKRIIDDLPDELLMNFKIIEIEHNDILRGNVTNAIAALKHFNSGGTQLGEHLSAI
jgi:hypothetical protein